MTRFIGVAPRLSVADLNRTVEFYRNVLGFIVASLWPDGSPSFAILARDEVHLQFYAASNAEPAEPVGHATIWIDVTDALAIHDALERRVTVEWGPEVYWYGQREFSVRDPDGYLIVLSEGTDDPPTCHET